MRNARRGGLTGGSSANVPTAGEWPQYLTPCLLLLDLLAKPSNVPKPSSSSPKPPSSSMASANASSAPDSSVTMRTEMERQLEAHARNFDQAQQQLQGLQLRLRHLQQMHRESAARSGGTVGGSASATAPALASNSSTQSPWSPLSWPDHGGAESVEANGTTAAAAGVALVFLT